MTTENDKPVDKSAEAKASPASRKAKKKKRKGRKRKKKSPKKGTTSRGRKARGFPASTFEEALTIPNGIQKFAAGQKIRRLTLFDKLQKSPDSGPSRMLVTNSSKYGLTTGGYQAEYLELTPDGAVATNPEVSARDRLRARFKLAIANIEPFNLLYERYKGSKLPIQAVMRDTLLDSGMSDDDVSECVDTFVLNAKFLNLLQQVAGAERLLPLDHVLEELSDTPPNDIQPLPRVEEEHKPDKPAVANVGWTKVCFYITPIGEPDSEERRHSDLFLSSIVEPALDEFELKVIRADDIGEAGMISRQIIEHIVHARLVIADLSYHNPNVFYELCLRHACRKPTVQIIRASDRLPFDLDQVRTIKIDTSSIYSLVPKLETHKSEIANQVRRALNDPDAVDNPISIFFPNLRTTIETLPK